MTASDAAKLETVPLRVTDSELIPAQRYYDPAFFELERERLWPHVWQMACRLEEIPEVGDYTEYTILEKSVIIIRTKNGVKAFHNACRHRGVRLATGPGNCKGKGFHLPVPWLALECRRRKHLCFWQAGVQRRVARQGRDRLAALPDRILGGLRLYQF